LTKYVLEKSFKCLVLTLYYTIYKNTSSTTSWSKKKKECVSISNAIMSNVFYRQSPKSKVASSRVVSISFFLINGSSVLAVGKGMLRVSVCQMSEWVVHIQSCLRLAWARSPTLFPHLDVITTQQPSKSIIHPAT